MDNVSLTCVPASEANSLENDELRVDGYDTLTQPLAGQCKASSGYVRGYIRPRHNAADFNKFAEQPVSNYLLDIFGDASNRIGVFASAANTIFLGSAVGGAWTMAAWDCTGAIVADTKYLLEVEYTASWVQLRIDGLVVVTLVKAMNFVTVPTTAYWGSSSYLGASQGDMTFDEP